MHKNDSERNVLENINTTIKNGIKIMVPGHIEVGTKIIIKPADGTYVEKSKL